MCKHNIFRLFNPLLQEFFVRLFPITIWCGLWAHLEPECPSLNDCFERNTRFGKPFAV